MDYEMGTKLDQILSNQKTILQNLSTLLANDQKIFALLTSLPVTEKNLMASLLDPISAGVANLTTADASIMQLCTNIAGQLASMQSVSNLSPADQATLASLVTTLNNEAAAVAANVLANTPAAPVTPVVSKP